MRFGTSVLLLTATLAVSSSDSGCRGRDGTLPDSHDTGKFQFTRILMGSPVRIVVYAESAGGAEDAAKAAQAAFAEVEAVDRAMSDYRPDSDLSRLNAAAGRGPQPIPPSLLDVLARAGRISEETEGAFDVTVGPVVVLWREARKTGRLPDPAALRDAVARVGRSGLRLDPVRGTAALDRPGMAVDVGGIAKGYAADRALAVLRARGFPRAFVACAGDFALGDPPPGRTGWRIRIGDDAAGKALVAANRGISTSGDTEQFVEIDGRRYSHIVDPRTGLGVEHVALATVVAPDATRSDALATALVVLGPARGLAAAARLGVEARMVWREKETVRQNQTKGMEAFWMK